MKTRSDNVEVTANLQQGIQKAAQGKGGYAAIARVVKMTPENLRKIARGERTTIKATNHKNIMAMLKQKAGGSVPARRAKKQLDPEDLSIEVEEEAQMEAMPMPMPLLLGERILRRCIKEHKSPVTLIIELLKEHV